MTQAQRIFIGDVQGCSEELKTLVKRAEKAYGSDFVLWVAGDLVNRGPGNLAALTLVRDLFEQGRAQVVLGNHEIFLIAVALGVRELRPTDSVGDVLACEDADDWVDWLRGLPLVVPGEIDGHRFVMLHASSHPDWSFEELLARGRAVSKRLARSRRSARLLLAEDAGPGTLGNDLGRLTRCRTIAADGEWSSFEPDGSLRPWHAVWSKRAHDFGIVYGHWARQGLHFADGLRGLDTGCVHHGRGRDGFLTAWLPDSAPPKVAGRPFAVPDDRLWQVPALRRYYTPEDTPVPEPG
jgi:bis(5'-nucleosyl)-tetraphosphatase (symmetrical)